MDLAQLDGWIPIRIYWQDSRPMVDWCFLGAQRFRESFFDETIDKCLRQPFNLLFHHQTPIELLEELQDARPGLPPTGFIFHMSRCGSTLLSQTLAALPQNIVISEADPIDTVLRANRLDLSVTDDLRVTWLRGLINAFGRPRYAEERHLFVKFDSWSVLDLPIVRRAFPSTPWVFLYRDPVEIMVSHAQSRGWQMLPGMLEPALLGLQLDDIHPARLDEYCARVLACFCQAATQYHEPDTALAINYHELLLGAFWSEIVPLFGLSFTEDEVARMQAVTAYHAKQPNTMFVDDSKTKQQIATPEIRTLAEQFVMPWIERLDVLNEMERMPYAEEL